MTVDNRLAFLTMLKFSEGTSTSPATRQGGYDVIVTGADGKPETFSDFADHPFAGGRPPKLINAAKGLYSSASGAYQHLVRDWLHYRALLHLPSFGPASQDLWAMQLIRERGALPLIDGGSFDLAVARCSNLWASLPGAGYDQREQRLDTLRFVFTRAGGTVG